MKKKLLAVVALATVAACGGKKTAKATTYACDIPSQGLCQQDVGTAAAMSAAGYTAEACTAASGTMVGACPATNRIGTCSGNVQTSAGQLAEVIVFYQGWDTNSAQQACANMGGSWKAG